MLVLRRKCGEAIVIADNITVTILEVRQPGETRFCRANDATIHRAEVYENIEHCLPTAIMPKRFWPELDDLSVSDRSRS